MSCITLFSQEPPRRRHFVVVVVIVIVIIVVIIIVVVVVVVVIVVVVVVIIIVLIAEPIKTIVRCLEEHFVGAFGMVLVFILPDTEISSPSWKKAPLDKNKSLIWKLPKGRN